MESCRILHNETATPVLVGHRSPQPKCEKTVLKMAVVNPSATSTPSARRNRTNAAPAQRRRWLPKPLRGQSPAQSELATASIILMASGLLRVGGKVSVWYRIQ
ncbi:hypothetical protein B0H17DRAFT_1097620, partial [Mycena rosella]